MRIAKIVGLCVIASTACAHTELKPGIFVGVGGSYNSMRLTQAVSGVADSNVYTGGIHVAEGMAGGPATELTTTESSFAPNGQIGYFGRFNQTSWLGGAKFFYQYLGTTITNSPVNLPQNGEFTTLSGSNAFTGNAVIESSQTSIDHQMGWLAFLGHEFKNSFIYLGAGPALLGINSALLNGTGYADINGVHTDITGATLSFSEFNWVWGGVAQLGMTYFFNPSWFIDVSYTYVVTGDFTMEDSQAFSNTTTNGGSSYTTSGILYVENTQSVMTQSVALTINKRF